MFLTETASIGDVVLPAANAYEKSGTLTNTCGDLQLLRKPGEATGTKPDFDIIVRIAARMAFDVRKLVPFGGAMWAQIGQSRRARWDARRAPRTRYSKTRGASRWRRKLPPTKQRCLNPGQPRNAL